MVLSTANRDPEIEAANGILYSLTTLAVALRLYTRSRIIRKVGTSDWWMLAAWVGLNTFGMRLSTDISA
jgi:hypothetical protein